MSTSLEPFAMHLVLIGSLLLVDLGLEGLLRRAAIPSVVAHLAVGIGLALVGWGWGWPGAEGRAVVELLGSVGIVFLLFRVGLESNLGKLVENLRRAMVVWGADVVVSGTLGFLVAHCALGIDLVPSLFVATALTATSVGVSVAVWREEGRLGSPRGQLLLDVAELDDISGIALMAVLFAVVPLLRAGETAGIASSVGWTVGAVLVRLLLFAGGCALFARFLEAPLTRLLAGVASPPDRLVMVASVGLVIAAAAGGVGFSLAIGAFFGGLAFSRDPEAVKVDAYFEPLYAFFTPFFFIGIGLRVDPARLGEALVLGLLLFLAAAAGKLLGAGGGSLIALRPRGAALIGVSMIPRAEIAMIVMQHGVLLGAWAVSETIFSAMVVVSLLSCMLAPIGMRAALRRVEAA
jgi:Kef-type K+ transport system membrane component KefB